MLYTIQNQSLRVTVDGLGAQVLSVTGADGTEYLWYGDKTYWKSRSPVLFPYVGRCTGGRYTLDGKEYALGIHGFARDSVFTPDRQDGDRLVLSLTDSPETRACYPYAFRFSVTYALEGSTLAVTYTVENRSDRAMHFGLGAHPGFRLPLEEGLCFEDYCLEFAHPCRPARAGLAPDFMMAGQEPLYPLEEDRIIPLTHSLFDGEAVILRHADRTVSIRSRKGRRGVTVHYPQMQYIAFWQPPHTDAPFVCLEPWVSLPARSGVVEDLAQQADLIYLPQGERYVNRWTITVF